MQRPSGRWCVNPPAAIRTFDGQSVIPYGAQLLVASSLAGIAAIDIVPWSIYQGILLVAALVSIAVRGGKASKRA